MGCWNGTCGISNLPIMHGEEVVLFPIKRQQYARTNSGGYVYPHDQFVPLSVGVHGEYDDYGGIENITRNGELVFKQLTGKNFLGEPLLQPVEKELERHTSFLKKSAEPSTPEELFNDFIERGIYKDVGFMMIRKDIFNVIISNLDDKKKKYQQQAQSLIDLFQVRKKSLEEEIDEYKAELTQTTNKERREKLERSISRQEIHLKHPQHDFEFEMKCHQISLGRMFYSFSDGFGYMKSIFMEAIVNADKNIMDDLIDLVLIELSMYDLRKGWNLQSGTGSQNGDVDLHIEIATAIIKSAIRIKYRWDLQDLYDGEKGKVYERISEIENFLVIAKSRANGLGKYIESIMEEE